MIDNVRQLWKYRSLIGALVIRHLSIRYRGSALGFLWSILTPLCLMLVYTLVFQFYMRGASHDHYSIFLFCGLLPWLWLSSALQEGTAAIVSGGHLITKSMFPPQVLPVVSILTSMVNFLLSLPLLFFFMALAGIPFRPSLLLLPVIMVLQFVFTYGMVLGLSALNVYFRDVQHILGNILTFLFFLCPIIYSADVVPARFRALLDYNPAAILTQWYHQVLLDGAFPRVEALGTFAVFMLAAVVLGNAIFDRYREGFAELL